VWGAQIRSALMKSLICKVKLNLRTQEGQVVANLGILHGRRGRREQALSCLETALDKLQPGSHAYRRVEEQLGRAS
jgi:hypothetical protein